jgi:hypothetical protein
MKARSRTCGSPRTTGCLRASDFTICKCSQTTVINTTHFFFHSFIQGLRTNRNRHAILDQGSV